MVSVPRRFRQASVAERIQRRDRPPRFGPGPGAFATLVASTQCDRSAAMARPTISSDAPPA